MFIWVVISFIQSNGPDDDGLVEVPAVLVLAAVVAVAVPLLWLLLLLFVLVTGVVVVATVAVVDALALGFMLDDTRLELPLIEVLTCGCCGMDTGVMGGAFCIAGGIVLAA